MIERESQASFSITSQFPLIQTGNKIAHTVDRLRLFIFFFLIVEIVYSRGIPLVWLLVGSSYSYKQFGIPSLTGLLYGFIICLGAYEMLVKRSNSKYYYIIIGIAIVSRQLILSIIIEYVVLLLSNEHMKAKKSKINLHQLINLRFLLILGAAVAMFIILGNFRSGNGVMFKIFMPAKGYENLSSGIR
jgi:hypothetical protein